jgi:hypothetical protein
MIWHADGTTTYRSGPYRVYWGIQFWTAWMFGGSSSHRRIGDAPTMKQAMALCADHAKEPA